MHERPTFQISGNGSPETPFHIDGYVEDGLIAIAAAVSEDDKFDKPVIIDTPAGILRVKMTKVGSGQGQVVFETTPVLTSRQDMLVQYASTVASLFTTQYIAKEIQSHFKPRSSRG